MRQTAREIRQLDEERVYLAVIAAFLFRWIVGGN